jgi:conjugal transfer pilus assembly protein TraV
MLKHTETVLRVVALTAVAAIVQGCASIGSYTNGEYGCTGQPDGVLCTDVQTVYELTDGDDYVDRINELRRAQNDDGGSAPEEDADPAASRVPGADPNGARGVAQLNVRGVVPKTVRGVVPLRTPAEVMRVYVRPWETKDGDLYVPGYIYTEIEARRWLIGDKAVSHSEKITVLSNPESEPTRARNAGGPHAAGESVRKTIKETLAGH